MTVAKDARERIAAALELLPTGSLLQGPAVAIHDEVKRDRTHSCGHGLVIAERITPTPTGHGVDAISGLRLVVLRNRNIIQQRISGHRGADWEEWTAPAEVVNLERIADAWSVDEIIAGVERIVDQCKARPEKSVRTLETAKKRLDELRRR